MRIKFTNYVILFFLILAVFAACDEKKSVKQDEKSVNEKPEEKIEQDSLYAIIMVGDVMMGTNYPSEGSLPPDDGKYILEDAAEFLQIADVTIGNLEGTLLDKGGTPKQCQNPENCVSFRMPEHYAGYLKDAGFDIMSTANNHSGDMGETGRKSTMKTLDEYGIVYAGYSTNPTSVFVKDGVKFGFTAFAPNNGTQSINDIKSAIKTVKDLKSTCDIVIVAFHGGGEGSGATHVNRKRELYLGEDRGNVYDFAHAVVDAGADVVFGQGPHVPRGLELYKNKIIAYSLGNFCTYGKFGLSGNLGLAPILKVYINKKGDFEKGRIFPFKQIKRGFPVFDDDYSVVALMRSLTVSDFPETNIAIEEDGAILLK
ncbi:MAG: CapA family protein [Ignavibacteria bacterium]|nr:CapA family protein [Ignavibacteria bacterium]